MVETKRNAIRIAPSGQMRPHLVAIIYRDLALADRGHDIAAALKTEASTPRQVFRTSPNRSRVVKIASRSALRAARAPSV